MRPPRWLAALLLLLTAIAAGPARAAKRPISDARREKIAIAAVERKLQPWVRPADDLRVRGSLVAFGGDIRNPITGPGPIEVYAHQYSKDKPTRWGRIRRAFDPYHRRVFVVDVDRNGVATVLEQRSLALQHRLGRALTLGLPLAEIGHDLVHSREVHDGVFIGGIGAAAAPASKSVAIVALVRAGQLVVTGFAKRREAREQALQQTIAWARHAGEGGSYPTLMTAYRHYQRALDQRSQGTRPVGLKQFADLLAANDL
jgi:hypothetical protein